MNDICSLTNDGFGGYTDDGKLILGDNDGKGTDFLFSLSDTVQSVIVP